jgi:hypothetical protein
MATHVTSLLRNGPRRLNFRAPMCSCRFAMMVIANLRHASTLVPRPFTESLHARLTSSKLQSPCLFRAKSGCYQSSVRTFISLQKQSALLHQEK